MGIGSGFVVMGMPSAGWRDERCVRLPVDPFDIDQAPAALVEVTEKGVAAGPALEDHVEGDGLVTGQGGRIYLGRDGSAKLLVNVLPMPS